MDFNKLAAWREDGLVGERNRVQNGLLILRLISIVDSKWTPNLIPFNTPHNFQTNITTSTTLTQNLQASYDNSFLYHSLQVSTAVPLVMALD